MKFLFKYPTRGRPEWFRQTLNLYYFMLGNSNKNEYEFLITLNTDDETMNNNEMREFMDSYTHLRYKYGEHKDKIAAVNADMENEDFDILFLISDDMTPIVPGFDNIIVELMQKYFPKLDGALHFDDDCLGGNRTITLSIMGKKLYDRFGYIYHPDYQSFYCDVEFTDEVRRMKKVFYSPLVIVKHDYKGNQKNRDETYRRNSTLGIRDKATYERRKVVGFPK